MRLIGFQSLSRDSGRLNKRRAGDNFLVHCMVSIPQSGFGAFEHNAGRGTERHPGVSIPQSGFGAFELNPSNHLAPPWYSFNPSVGIRGV